MQTRQTAQRNNEQQKNRVTERIPKHTYTKPKERKETRGWAATQTLTEGQSKAGKMGKQKQTNKELIYTCVLPG
jgi:hypothetical protein